DGTFAGMSMAFGNEDSYLITDQADIRPALERLDNGQWTMQNAMFDLRVLRRYADVPQRFVWDTMLVEQDLYGGWFDRFNLQNLVRRYLREKRDKTIRDEFQKKVEMTPEMEAYAVQDAWDTVQIAKLQREYVKSELGGEFTYYTDIDEPSIWALLDIKPNRVDVDAWLANNELMVNLAAEKEEELGFNVYSHKVVKKEIEASLGRKIKSTNAKSVLEPLLSRIDPQGDTAKLVRAVLEVRRARKAAETYGEGWIEQHVSWVDGIAYVYPSWKITGAETGRMSCSRPNMQNIPARRMPIFRTFFPASPGHVMQVADVSQQEPGFSAFLSKDPVLMDEIQRGVKGYDVNMEIFGVDYDTSKTITLGMNYGMSEYGVAAAAQISLDEAVEGIRQRERRYRVMTSWQAQQVKFARRNYHVKTVTGRRVWVNPYLVGGGWERNAANGPVQGSAADHTKLAFVLNHAFCQADNMPFQVTGVIHDEMTQDVPEEEKEWYRGCMQDAWDTASERLAPGIPMRIAISEGENWGAK
ncbi:hypothetical protein LCGC14_2351030, partial [marine sediment metagenome]